jgi:hypothetical protein
MKVSVDGLRRNMARSYKKAISGYRQVVGENGHDDSFTELKDGLDEIRQWIGAFMCMYSDNPDDLMSNMTDDAMKLPFADPGDRYE